MTFRASQPVISFFYAVMAALLSAAACFLFQFDVVGEGHLGAADADAGLHTQANLRRGAILGEAAGEVLQFLNALLREEVAEVGVHTQRHGGGGTRPDGVTL